MIKKLLLSLGVIFLCTGIVYSQQSTVKGTIKDTKGEPLGYARVLLKQDGKNVNGANADAKGEYQIFGVAAGTYDLEATGTVGCTNSQTLSGIYIASSEVKFVDVAINCTRVLDPVEVKYVPPVFDKDKTTQSVRLTGEEVRQQPGRSITSALSNMEGVTSVDGSITSVRGQREEGQQMIIDGVRVRGSQGISMQSVEEAEMIQGGIPAEYGDGTSFAVITTKGVSKKYNGSIELRGSIDGYNNFLAAASISGPIIKGKRDEPARLGFMLSAETFYNVDSRPLRGGYWVAKDEVIDEITRNPLRYDPVEYGQTSEAAKYLGEDAFYKRRVKDNAQNWGYLLQGKIDIIPMKSGDMRISLTGSYDYSKGKAWDRLGALFNVGNNPESSSSTMRFGGRLNHRVYRNDTTKLKNVMYDLTFGYTKVKSLYQNSRLKDNIFAYGHVGKFKTTQAASYAYLDGNSNGWTDSLGITYYDMYIFTGYWDSVTTFIPGPYNPQLVPYTQGFLDNFPIEDIYQNSGGTVPYNLDLYQRYGALVNGMGTGDVYSIRNMSLPGGISDLYQRAETDAFSAKASLSMNIGNHELKLGYEFDRISSRAFSVSPIALWTLMRSRTNSHIMELDEANYYISGDTIHFNRLISSDKQSTFDRSLRQQLGLDVNGSDWIDLDNLDPEIFSLDMFSAEELLLDGYISYYGYDYTGKNKYKKSTDIKDFFTNTDERGNKTYNIGAYEPIYMSIYLQDKFSINSLLFNVGVRVDRFDANQFVLKDPYLFRESYTVGAIKEMLGTENINGRFVSNAEDDWVVYVSQKHEALNLENQTIIGYRNGNTWYDNEGKEVNNAETILGANGGPILYRAIEDAEGAASVSKVEYQAFTKYKARWSVMPRLSFSFPVSDNSIFTAHYNIVTLRPTNLQLNPISYLFIESYGSNPQRIVSNPNLKPQKTITYEIGFSQKVGAKSAIGITAYYSEQRDMIQSYRFTGAYPSTYYSYDNQDFGTVQGFSFSYRLAKTKNVSLRASYTIQFAKGTGSSSSSNLSIIQTGQPNLRTLTNLSFDQRHRFNVNIDYRFGGGAEYNGPVTERVTKDGKKKTINWLANTGINVVFNAASGLPYSRSSTVVAAHADVTSAQLSGSINGSHKPWTFECNVRLDKMIPLNLTKKGAIGKDGNEKDVRIGHLVVYLDIANLFNFKNVLSVYRYTGNPDDDGFLTSSQYQSYIRDQTVESSYRNYYSMAVNNPYNYVAPIRASLGIQFFF